MLKKELLEAINVLILYSDFCDINIDDDRFDVKFSYYGKKDIIDSVDRIDFSQPTHEEKESHVSFIESKENKLPKEENPIIPSIAILNCANDDLDKQKENKIIWPHGKKPSLDLESFKIALTQYIAEHPEEKQKEIGKAFGLDTSSINKYIKIFRISYSLKRKRVKEKIDSEIELKKSDESSSKPIAPQATTNNGQQGDSEIIPKEAHNGDMSNHLKKELHTMIKNAVLGINKTQKELDALKEKFDSFKNNGYKLTASKLGTWILKSFNGSGGSEDSDFEFNGLGISAEYQLFPRWEIGRSYCILQFYGKIKSVDYIVNEKNGQIRVSRRP